MLKLSPPWATKLIIIVTALDEPLVRWITFSTGTFWASATLANSRSSPWPSINMLRRNAFFSHFPPGCQLSSLLWLSGLLQPSPPPSDVYWFQYPLARERNSKIGIRLLGEQEPVSVKGRPAERPSERKAFSLDCFTNRAAEAVPHAASPSLYPPPSPSSFSFPSLPSSLGVCKCGL